MRNYFWVLFFLICYSAYPKDSFSGNVEFDINSTPEEKWEVMQDYMAHGANASDKRPSPDILSEQEVLLKAADYAYTIGALHPSYYVYDENPTLLTAKIETVKKMY